MCVCFFVVVKYYFVHYSSCTVSVLPLFLISYCVFFLFYTATTTTLLLLSIFCLFCVCGFLFCLLFLITTFGYFLLPVTATPFASFPFFLRVFFVLNNRSFTFLFLLFSRFFWGLFL